MQKTVAPNSSSGAFVDEVPGTIVGTTWQAADANAHQNEICNAITFNSGLDGWIGQTLSGSDIAQLFETIVKASIEHSHYVGELFYELDYAAPAAFNSAHPHAYRPALCIDTPTAGTPYQTLLASHWPQLVPYLVAFRSTVFDGQAGQTAQFTVTTGVVNANIVTLTLDTSNASKGIVSALAEDAICNNTAAAGFLTGAPSWTNWQTITLPSNLTIGADTINAGTYTMIVDAVNNSGLAVDPTARKVSFSYTASNQTSTGVTGVVEFHPFAVAGSSTTAQIMAMQGRTLISTNDPDPLTNPAGAGYPRYIPGQRVRDRGMGHIHTASVSHQFMQTDLTGWSGSGTGTDTPGTPAVTILGPTTDGTNGNPRLGPTTDPRALTAHLYIGGGQYQ